MTAESDNLSPNTVERLEKCRSTVATQCTECMVCVKQCLFLQTHGTPKALAEAWERDSARVRALAYECSLCGLCAKVCPQGVDPFALFLELRREAVRLGETPLKRYGVLLGYEKRGNSRLFSYYGLPAGCDTVLFPGCNIPGSRPTVTWDLFQHLRQTIPTLGIVLDCCNKPSHDLGRQDFFEEMFGETRRFLLEHGVRRVLVACPNCYKVFKAYGGELEVQTVYEALRLWGLPPQALDQANAAAGKAMGPVVLHDPCPLRYETAIQDTVREFVGGSGLVLEEMRHRKERTVCCGEGGAVSLYKEGFAEAWGRLRADEAKGRPVLTYCAGCANYLKDHMEVYHVLDLLFRPAATLSRRLKVVQSPFTYLRRLLLKRRFRREVEVAVSRERAAGK